MPLSSLTKKAMAFAVTALCSLASVGVGGPARSKENPPMMHDSLYDSWVATAYNALPNDPDIEPCLDGFYAPVYFSNLRTNFGTNRFGTCAFVAMGMLLSFYDTYWDNSIVPSAYDVNSSFQAVFPNGSIESPGSKSCLSFEDVNDADDYFDAFVPQNDGQHLDMKLITLATQYSIELHEDGYYQNQGGLNYSGMYSLFQHYLYSYMGFSTSDIGFVAEPGTGTGQAKSDSVRDYAIDMVMEGTPVLLSVGTDLSATTGRHAVIAYDYDEANDLLYCHMGWGPKATHCTIESFGYTSYNSAFSLVVRTQHSHSYRYGLDTDRLCACRFAAPYDIRTVDWYRNEEPGFEWSCLDKERWVGDLIKYVVNTPDYSSDNGLKIKRWCVPWNAKHSDNNNTTIYDSSSVSVTITAEYDDDYYNISDIDRSAIFPGITDFSGAHNVHPEDYGFSPNVPTTSTQATHYLEGGSFSIQTIRKGVNEDEGMVNIIYAREGYNDSYIEYHMPSGISAVGIDFGVRFWDDTNASHGFVIEYYEDYDWQISANLLDNSYDIAGSDGDTRWVHHSFGRPVEAFAFHAYSSGAGYYDCGIAGLLNVAIYTLQNETLPLSGSELPYSPGLWNDGGAVEGYSNCYRYALNFPCLTNVQNYWEPGQYSLTDDDFPGQTKEAIVTKATFDSHAYKQNHPTSNAHFSRIGRMEVCPSGCYKVALYINLNNNGIHWFRQNYDGTWSQKNGSSPITNKDGSNRTIFDPQFCNTSYNYFCGYYCVGPWTGYGVS